MTILTLLTFVLTLINVFFIIWYVMIYVLIWKPCWTSQRSVNQYPWQVRIAEQWSYHNPKIQVDISIWKFYSYTPAQRSWWGVHWNHLVRLSVCPSVCRRHGFRNVTQVCFGISIWNFICMLLMAIGRSLLIFSDVTFKTAAWRPSWISRFPDSSFCLALNNKSKLQ